MGLTINKGPADSQQSRIKSSYDRLAKTAASLNAASDHLSTVIIQLEKALRTLNIGVSAWVGVSTGGDTDPEYYTIDELGYAKIDGEWAIGLRTRWGIESEPDREQIKEWAFIEASREMRVRAVQHIPKLIEELERRASEMTKKLHEKTAIVQELSSAISELAAQEKGGR